MRYELFLRPQLPEEGDAADPAGTLLQRARQREPALQVDPYREEGILRGVDLSLDVELAPDPELLPRAAFELAAGLTVPVQVFDPQLGRVVDRAAEGLVLARMNELRAFGQAAPLTPEPAPARSPLFWIALLLGGVLLLVTLLNRLIGCALGQ